SAVTPKLGALYRATAAWSVFGNFAGGFRAPNAQQVNGTFDSSTIAAVLLPNPDLKSEKSKNLEFGVRGVMDKLSVDFAAFTGKYDNLIYDKKPLGGRGVTGDPAIFQTVNIDKATIYGFELKGNVNWGSFSDARWSTPFSYGVTHGNDDSTDLPLNSIIPAKLHAGLKMELPMWDLRLDARYQEAKREGDLDSPYLPKPALPPRIKQFTIPSALTLDLSGQWRIRNDLRLNAGVANITNKKYWNWSDVQGLAATSVVTDAYTQAGRHYSMSLVMDF
ncbi:MAG: TonB-dependent receptor, partial [Undibacterium sp.]|nr:TonB-dependent receptor [Undibacterium sp.]